MVMSQLQTQNRIGTTTTDTPASTRTNRTAIWALVLAILTLGGVGSVLGIVLGVRARTQARGSGERGAGLAMAAIVVGVVTLLVAIGYWIVIAQHVGGSSGGGGGSGGGY
jgi:hypothetical protein